MMFHQSCILLKFKNVESKQNRYYEVAGMLDFFMVLGKLPVAGGPSNLD